MTPLHIETPFIESSALRERLGRSVWLKMEALQPPGSFKIRGIGLKCQQEADRGAGRLLSSSGGNAGIAVAYAGRRLGLPVVVYVPNSTSERAKALIRQEGAQIVVHGASWQEANDLAVSQVGPRDAFIHPFDDPVLWRGHATMIDEIARCGPRPDAVVLAVGGGGLLSGVVEGLHKQRWTDVPVIAVETRGADSLHQSLAAGSRVELPAITSIASSLGARRICANAMDLARQHPIRSVVVTDKQALAACRAFLADQRVVVEPACGAALAAAYDNDAALGPFATVAVIVCGGATATPAQVEQWAAQV
jgi:L-serine/L-threonine ammonia-lyase